MITSYEILTEDRDRYYCHWYMIEAMEFKKVKQKHCAQDVTANTHK